MTEVNANTEHPKLALLRGQAAEIAKRAAKAKPKDFEVAGQAESWKPAEGDSLQGVYLGADTSGQYLMHLVGVAEGDNLKQYRILGTTVLNARFKNIEAGKQAVRVTYKGMSTTEGGRPLRLWEVGVME